MSMDFSYYYDFDSEPAVRKWTVLSKGNGRTVLSGELECAGERFPEGFPWEWVALYPRELEVAEINGIPPGDQSRSLYVGFACGRSGIRINLTPGKNQINVGIASDKMPEPFELRFVPGFTEVPRTEPVSRPFSPSEMPVPPEGSAEWRLPDGTPGAGRKCSPGRFGFTKGDGLLDCAVGAFGLIDKMYLCGHPKYRKPYRWGYCVLPGAEKAVRSGMDAENGKIRVNQLSVNWQSQGVGITYSLGSPGIITECPDRDMRLSQLEFAGNYRYVMTASYISAIEEFRSESMTENWLLLFGCAEFPDVPILIVLDRKPEKLEIGRLPGGRLSNLGFKGCRRMITATPFGMESPEPNSPDDTAFLADASSRARMWSRALLAFPVNCMDRFKNDFPAGKCRISQEFSYRIFTDEWGTAPLKLAPFPPAAVLAGTAALEEGASDLRFPTKYGPFFAVGGETSSYNLPLMPPETRFPLQSDKSEAAGVLKDGLKEYFDFQAAFPDDWRPYAYIGSALERYGFAAMMFQYMEPEFRDHLAQKAADMLRAVCEPEGEYTCLLTEHSRLYRLPAHTREQTLAYYRAPAMQRKRMRNYYSRREPFTGAEYLICYLNVGWLREHRDFTEEEIAKNPVPYVENDWGLGISIYMLYMCALASGRFEEIRKNWKNLRKMFDYLDIYHDWACLSAGYAECGTTWCEGANYGAYSAFAALAEAAGDEEAKEFGTYLAAKEMALRAALYRSSGLYFCKRFGVEPYGITKAFREEDSPNLQFQCVPKELDKFRLRPFQLHTYLTEGAFPELFRHFRRFLPENHAKTITRYLKQILAPDGPKTDYFWGRELSSTMILLDMADDSTIPEREVREALDSAREQGCLIGECRDIGTFATFQPMNLYRAMILAQLENRGQFLELEHWEDVRILRAEWKDNTAEIGFVRTGERPKIRCRVRKELFTASEPFASPAPGTILFAPDAPSGSIAVRFNID